MSENLSASSSSCSREMCKLIVQNVLLSYGSCGWRAPLFLHFMVQLDLDLPSSSALSCFAKVIGLTTVDALDSMTHSHASGNKSAKVLLLSLLCLFQSILKAFSCPLGRARGLKVRWKKVRMTSERNGELERVCLHSNVFVMWILSDTNISLCTSCALICAHLEILRVSACMWLHVCL